MTYLEKIKITFQYLSIFFICAVCFFGIIFTVLYMAFIFCSYTNGICVDVQGR